MSLQNYASYIIRTQAARELIGVIK